MKVYIVTEEYEYAGGSVMAVFSDIEMANAYAKNQKPAAGTSFDVEEYEVIEKSELP